MTIADWLVDTMIRLNTAGVDAPRRDALVLLEDSIEKDRAWVVAHPEHVIDTESTAFHTLKENVERRLRREPLAYIRGRSWFYGRFFAVTPDVMVPRPESEAFIELLKELKPSDVIDVGTGSGCLAITTKLELPRSKVTAIDISPETLKVAKQNALVHGADIDFIQSDLLTTLTATIQSETTIIANLPYVPDGLITSPEISTEPALALFSGKDGLDHYRKFWDQIKTLKTKPNYILTESLESQHDDIEKLAYIAGYKMQKTEQLTQLFTPQT